MNKLKISLFSEYRKRYKEDPRLTSIPYSTYKGKGWINFHEFLGRETSDLYPTYEEAKQAVNKLKISIFPEYRKRHKEDPRLPYNPYRTYEGKGWIDAYDFFGKTKKVNK